jgi:hypothetical protein
VQVLVDANQMYEDSIVNLKTRKPVEKRAIRNYAEREQAAKDYYASVRTNVSWVEGWMFLPRLMESNNSDLTCVGSVECKPNRD